MSPFDSALAAAVDVANRAPSSHNSQPWALVSAVDPTVREGFGCPDDRPLLVICLDRNRALEALATHDAEMMMSCGMYLHVLLDALAARGFVGAPIWRTGQPRPTAGAWPDALEPLMAVALTSGPADPAAADALERTSADRRTNRAPYAGDAPGDAELAALSSPRTRLDPAARLAVNHDLDAARITAMGAFVRGHAAIDFAHHAAWSETYGYVRFGPDEVEAAEDGFAITQLFGPLGGFRRGVLRVALAPTTMRMLKYVGYPRIIAKGLGDLVAGTAATVCLCTPDGAPDRGALLVAGGLIMDYWMKATDQGLAMHPVSVILQHDDIRHAFQSEFGFAGRAVFFARLGKPEVDFPPTPRRRSPRETVLRTI